MEIILFGKGINAIDAFDILKYIKFDKLREE